MKHVHIRLLMVASAAFFIACSPAIAQWQTPDHSVPVGRGASTGFKAAGPGSNNQALMGATGADPVFRALVGADLPLPGASSLGGTQSKTCTTSQWLNAISTGGVPACAQPAFSDVSGTAALSQLPAFSGMSAAAAVSDTDTIPTNQGAGNLKQTFAAIKTWIQGWIAKADVGLGNVDNTSDATKWAATKMLTNTTFKCDGTGNVCLVRLGSDVTGTLAKANGGLGATTLSSALDTEFSSTQGTILYRNSTAWVALSPGTAGQFLTTQGAGANPNWSGGGAGTGTVTSVTCGSATIATSGTCAYPYFVAYLSATQNVTSGVFTKIQANTKSGTASGQYDGTTNYRFTPTLAGTYEFQAATLCTGTTTTICTISIYKNGTEYSRLVSATDSTGGSSSILQPIAMNGSTDYVEFFVRVNCSASCQILGGNVPQFTWVSGRYVSP